MIYYYLVLALIVGIFLGQLIERYAYENRLISKALSAYRTGVFMRGRMYYIVTEREYVDKMFSERKDG